MGRLTLPDIWGKIGLNTARPHFDVAAAAAQAVLPQTTVVTPITATGSQTLGPASSGGAAGERHHSHWSPPSLPKILPDIFHRPASRQSAALAALALLLVGAAAIRLGGAYYTAEYINKPAAAVKLPQLPTESIAGFNIAVPAAEFPAKLKSITSQRVTLKVGSQSERISASTIKSWLQITSDKQKSEYYIHLNQATMSNSLLKLAKGYTKAPVNQVTVNEDGRSVVALRGRTGTALSDPGSLKTQAKEASKDALAGQGMSFNTPLKTLPYHAVTPAAFSKVIVADVTTKKMWAFQNGKQINSWLVSAGKPTTPTPIGEFHIYAKFTVQDMSGYNLDGSKYFQPNVRWVNYFYEGSAIHGVYWHPLSWFGAINSSHGCIGVPDNEAQWIFNWAPIGTTIIVHQ